MDWWSGSVDWWPGLVDWWLGSVDWRPGSVDWWWTGGLSVALNARNVMANCPNMGSWLIADTVLHWERWKVRPSVRS